MIDLPAAPWTRAPSPCARRGWRTRRPSSSGSWRPTWPQCPWTTRSASPGPSPTTSTSWASRRPTTGYHIVHAETHVPYVDFDAVLHSQCVFMYLIHCKHGHALNLYNYTLHKLTRKLLQISVWDLMFSPINRLYLFIVYL